MVGFIALSAWTLTKMGNPESRMNLCTRMKSVGTRVVHAERQGVPDLNSCSWFCRLLEADPRKGRGMNCGPHAGGVYSVECLSVRF